jgi:hypothetical protein
VRTITAKFRSSCHECGKPIEQGDTIRYDPETKWTFHVECVEEEEGPTAEGHATADRLGFGKKGLD